MSIKTFMRSPGGTLDIRDRLTEFAKQSGDKKHEPAPLLVRLANDGKGFGSLSGKD